MKTFFIFFLCLLSLNGSAQESASTPVPTLADMRMAPKIELGTTLPEDFDWHAHFAKANQSTFSRYAHLASSHEILKSRIDQLCSSYRQKLIERKYQKALEVFNKMQVHWEQAAEAEIQFAGLEYEGGSEAKVSFAAQRFRVYLRRVRELKDLGSRSYFQE